MSNAIIIFLLTLCIMILICIIVYQQFVFHNGTKAKIHEISSKLKELLDTDSDECLKAFFHAGVVNAQELVLCGSHVDKIRLALAAFLIEKLVHRLIYRRLL